MNRVVFKKRVPLLENKIKEEANKKFENEYGKAFKECCELVLDVALQELRIERMRERGLE